MCVSGEQASQASVVGTTSGPAALVNDSLKLGVTPSARAAASLNAKAALNDLHVQMFQIAAVSQPE